MSQLDGKTALITGGASGIGRVLGRRLLEEGIARLVIWDVQEQALEATVSELQRSGHVVEGACLDLADPASIRAAAQALAAAGIGIDLLVNNAGVLVGKPFAEHSFDDIRRILEVNTAAPLYVTRLFLPHMLMQGKGHIVNIASAAGLISNPGMSTYCASKWAIVGWSDSLRLEMEKSGTGVKVTTVAPYYINTGMVAGVRSSVIPILDPARVVERIILAIRTDRINLRLPWVVNLVPMLKGVLPARWFDLMVGRWLGIYRTMDHFRGRP